MDEKSKIFTTGAPKIRRRSIFVPMDPSRSGLGTKLTASSDRVMFSNVMVLTRHSPTFLLVTDHAVVTCKCMPPVTYDEYHKRAHGYPTPAISAMYACVLHAVRNVR